MRRFTAVDGISLRVGAGEFFGFLGPNGAGKTTTINAIAGLARKSAGSIRIFGHDNERDWRQARRLVGLSPQEYNFDRYLSLRDVLIFAAGYYGLRGKAVAERADMLLERFGLTSHAHLEYTKISGGQKRRLSLARALDPSAEPVDSRRADRRRRRRAAPGALAVAALAQRRRPDDLSNDALSGGGRAALQAYRDHPQAAASLRRSRPKSSSPTEPRCKTSSWS